MTALKTPAALLRAEADKARRLGSGVVDPLTRKLLADYALECEEAADHLDADKSGVA